MSWRPEPANKRRSLWRSNRRLGYKQFFLFGTFFCLLAAGLFFGYYAALASTFDIAQVGQVPERNRVYDRHGQEIEANIGAAIEQITFEDLPPFLVKALQAREDAEFFTHSGVHLRGLVRATLRNIKDKKFTQGASTLSMQLARNTYEIRAKSLHRKFLEIALTYRVEHHYSKQQIMAGYLNRIYFGVGAGHYGIQDASLAYFGKKVSQLNEAQCAMIIGIIRGPHIFSPWRDLDAAKEQRDQVLDRMIAMGFIDADEKKRIQALPLGITAPDQSSTANSYAIQAVVRAVNQSIEAEEIQRGGLKIFTTLDMPWQRRLERELQSAIRQLESERGYQAPTLANYQSGTPTYLQLSAATLETSSGAILALIGGRHFPHSAYDRSQSARRDLGSAFEPFVAAAASQRGRPIFPGSPVRTGSNVGPDAVTRIARRCGIQGPFAENEDLYRGAVCATPMEMARALATLANRGQRTKHYLIRRIESSAGEMLSQGEQESFPALTPAAAKEALQVLKPAGSADHFIGATGSEREAWMLRLGPKGSTAIWVGFDQPKVIAPADRLARFLRDTLKRLE
jgi:penicillin-binding protein 1A